MKPQDIIEDAVRQRQRMSRIVVPVATVVVASCRLAGAGSSKSLPTVRFRSRGGEVLTSRVVTLAALYRVEDDNPRSTT